MTKKDYLKVLVLTLFLSVVINVLFGRYLSVKLSTLPILNRFKIISPQAPIVLTSKEVVRVSETGDVLQVVNNTKPKLSSVMLRSGNNITVLGGAINLTSEGAFITTKSVIGANSPEQLLVKLNDGTVGGVLSIAADPASNLVVLKTDMKNVPVVSMAESKQFRWEKKLFF
jgi:S1-C subfamily serine protease